MAHKRHGRRGHKKKRLKSTPKLTDGQKYFLKSTGELHPSELKDSVRKYTKVKDEDRGKKNQIPQADSSSESEEDENPFQQLMTSIGQKTGDYESSEEDEDDQQATEEEDETVEAVEGIEEGSDEALSKGGDDDDDNDDDTAAAEDDNKGSEEDCESEGDDSESDENDDDDEEQSSDEEPVGKIRSKNKIADDTEDQTLKESKSKVDTDSKGSDKKNAKSKKKLAGGAEGQDLKGRKFIESTDSKDNEKSKNVVSKKKVADDVKLKGKKRKLEEYSGDEDVGEVELEDDEDDNIGSSDPFSVHFERDLQDSDAEKCLEGTWEKKEIKIPHSGKAFIHCRNWDLESKTKKMQNLHSSKVKQSLFAQVAETNRTMCNPSSLKVSDILTPLQHEIFSITNAYQDVYYPERTHHNREEIRLVYCLHALNHALKTRRRVISHNTKLKSKQRKSDADDCRDQGLTRPKVLLILPFREMATKVVNLMSSLLGPAEQVMVSSKKRFKSEFGAEDDQNYRRGLKPEDFESTFSGNNDDHFRLGIAVSKRSLKLYVPFYQADIILASPLGLRTIIGAEGEKDRDFDFLSSIEMLILDQTDVFLMQNWDHVLHIFKHLHLQPKESHGCDFSRVRMWTLNGWSHLYRQTLIFSAVATPEINAIFNKYCHNYAGKVQIMRNPGNGIICQIITQAPQTFQRLACTSFTQLADARFEYFIKKLVPHHKDPVMIQTLVYIPSYFDFVRIRNYFKKEDIDFVHMNEYASDKGISRVRCDFFHGDAQFLLYTERLHFYRRFQVRGIKHIIFYELPTYPHFYSEMCNMIKDPKRGVESASATCTVIYSKYDAQKLADVVGSKRAAVMLNSEKSVHMFVTGQDS